MTVFFAIVRREIKLATRQGASSLLSVAFFVIAASLYPFAIGPDPAKLVLIGSGVIWVAALLATLLSLDRLFQADFDDGSLDILALARQPLLVTVWAKISAHWLIAALPLIVVSPILGVFLSLPVTSYGVLVLALLLGTPALSLIGAVGAALTVGIRRGGVLLTLLILPLNIPVLIFGAAATEASVRGLDPQPALMLLAAMSLIALVVAPLAAAAAIRISLE